jgi:hypothetical protein
MKINEGINTYSRGCKFVGKDGPKKSTNIGPPRTMMILQ